MNIIEVNGISLRIRKDLILDNIDMSVKQGSIHGLIGRNGCGKTMLMKCICGFVRPTTGEITVRGKRVGSDCDFPDDIGIIIETPGFIPYYGGYRNLRLLAGLRRKIKPERIRQAMREVGLDPILGRHVRKYSMGMRQRLGLAQAVVENPDILILDEPMNGLDRDGVDDVRAYLKKFRDDGKTILVASHSEQDVALLCDTVTEMERGRILTVAAY